MPNGKISMIYRPAVYHGSYRMKGYFEGWYFKLVDKNRENAYAIIPGVSFDKAGKSHCFIQVLDGLEATSKYITYTISDFWYSTGKFEIKIGPNYFSDSRLSLSIRDNSIMMEGELSFGHLAPWPIKLFSPGAMGWYAFMPFMECYHGVISFDHAISGILNVNGREIDFTGGRGYIEKDWGRSFPAYHLWLQSNNFEQPGCSIMASIARIPWLGNSFDGFITGFLFQGKLYQFATYNGSRITGFSVKNDSVDITFSAKHFILDIEARRAGGAHLAAPVLGDMKGRLVESMTATVHVQLFRVEGNKKIMVYDGGGINTGLEIAGDIAGMKI
jgi:tocopherol cyclase